MTTSRLATGGTVSGSVPPGGTSNPHPDASTTTSSAAER
jgi:hypothetical protein